MTFLDEIAESAVVGIPDSKWGEVGGAFVVRRNSAAIDAAQLQRHCEQRLARYMIPKESVFVGEFPRNASGKILKTQLKKKRVQPFN